MGNHIATTDTYFVDALEMELTCPVCLNTSKSELGWTGMRCGECGAYSDGESANRTVRQRREHLGLTRAQIAEQTGVKVSTVRHYETWWPSQKYVDATRALVQSA